MCCRYLRLGLALDFFVRFWPGAHVYRGIFRFQDIEAIRDFSLSRNFPGPLHECFATSGLSINVLSLFGRIAAIAIPDPFS